MKFLKFIQLFLLCVTAIMAALCYNNILSLKPDNLFVFFGAVGGICAVLLEIYSRQTKKFSVAHVLAVGYVENFLEPVMIQIIEQKNEGDPPPKFFIFIPFEISKLDENSIVLLKDSLNNDGYKSASVNVQIPKQRTRNILLVTNSTNGDSFYFDIPTTLSSLSALIEYTFEKKKNTSPKGLKDDIFRKYMDYFKGELIEILKDKGLYSYVTLVKSVNEIK
ncbi:STING domain-containing protein [Mucilaginibacter sp.]|uniref:STING domain-containing protein n=1 Tax=Mucilaginibacter sp. TaxID=1882438 RepID=UPI002610B80B|nr:STING domain-containing protein [Mucilaginibacter sp.]MDB4918496.1 hypothetical protein [Mucilaginibacter sp.]